MTSTTTARRRQPRLLAAVDSPGTTNYVFACLDCHPTNQHATGPMTINKQDASVSGTRITLYTAGATSAADAKGFNYTVGGSCATACHTRDGVSAAPMATPFWNSAFTGACNVCHRASGDTYATMTTVATRLSITHATHMATDRYGANSIFTCNTCHSGTALDNTTINGATGRNQHPNQTKDVAFNATVGGSWNGTQCSNTYCHSNGTSLSGVHAVISWATATATACGSCHGDSSTLSTGAHARHLADATALGPITCNNCHNATAANNTALSAGTGAVNHVNQKITLQLNAGSASSSATYSGSSVGGASVLQKTIGSPRGTCNTTYCHGVNSGTWDVVNNDATCVKCHGIVSTSTASYNADTRRAAPGYLVSNPAGTGYNTAGVSGTLSGFNSVSTDTKVGAHNAHISTTGGYSATIACSACHENVVSTATTSHMDGSTTFAWSSPSNTGGLSPSYNASTATCSATYCHGNWFPAANRGAGTSPVWMNASYITSPASSLTNCQICHLSPPPFQQDGVASHPSATLSPTPNCNSCHGHNGSGPTHIDGVLQAAGGDCVGCHNAIINTTIAQTVSGGSVTQRRNIVSEFANTWSHKRSASPSGTVTKWDCIVCHMEGDPATGNTTTFHEDGYVDLRDSDTGLPVKAVTGFTGTPGSYTQGASNLRFVQFSRNLSVTLESDPNWLTVASVEINFCLKCHDANGALSTSAQVSAASGTAGTALKPFATTITGQVAPFNSNGQGNVVNVTSAFITTNASYHPVMGRANNSYVQGTRMISPYTATKTTGTNTQYGYLISCSDCHAAAGATGVQTRTVTAHGAPATLRGTAYNGGQTAATNLCLDCHATVYSTTAGNHGAGSAFATGGSAGDMTATIMQRCTYCHAYTAAVGGTNVYNLTSRPLRGENAHGFNDRTAGTVGSTWTTSGVKPYGFIRNTLSVWAPAAVNGVAPPSAHTCTGTSGTCGNDMSNSSYTPGGAY